MDWLGTLAAMGAFVALFVAFGLWVRVTGCDGHCDGCTAATCDRHAPGAEEPF